MNKLIPSILLSTALISVANADPSHQHGEGHKAHHNNSTASSDEHKHGHEHSKGHGKGHANGHANGHGQSLAGQPGSEQQVDRVIEVEATDAMRFIHDSLEVKSGETIKFVISNTGVIDHEFSIGTKAEHKAHSKMMMANPDMHHGPGGSSITIAPNTTETLIWTFKQVDEVEVACNIPGHYQAGMHSKVRFDVAN